MSQGIKSEQKVITPVLAAKILDESNHNNRKLSKPKVKQYVDSMIAGQWVENGESLKFDIKGNLIDGQHRLTACVQSGFPFITTVISGISDPSAFKTIDTGRPRGANQVLQMAGFASSNAVAAAARVVEAWDANSEKEKHIARPSVGVTNTMILEKAEEFEESVLKRGVIYAQNFPKGSGDSILFGTYLILSRIEGGKAEEFFDKLVGGLFSAKQDPCKLLIDRIYNNLGKWSVWNERTELMALVFKAYNLFCENDMSKKRLAWVPTSSFPLPRGV